MQQLNRSKYVQSDTRDTYRNVIGDLHDGLKVLYSGTACQIYGLLSFLNRKKVDISNLYTIDVICHGTPSPKLLREYIKWQTTNEGSDVLRVAMRGKVHKPAATGDHRRVAALLNLYKKVYNTIGINDMNFEDAYNEAIQQKSIAQQNADKQKIENEAAIAKAEADKQVAITNAEAEAQKTSIAAEAQAEANRKLAESLSDTLIDYQKVQKWDGKLPTVSGGNALVSIDPAE